MEGLYPPHPDLVRQWRMGKPPQLGPRGEHVKERSRKLKKMGSGQLGTRILTLVHLLILQTFPGPLPLTSQEPDTGTPRE